MAQAQATVSTLETKVDLIKETTSSRLSGLEDKQRKLEGTVESLDASRNRMRAYALAAPIVVVVLGAVGVTNFQTAIESAREFTREAVAGAGADELAGQLVAATAARAAVDAHAEAALGDAAAIQTLLAEAQAAREQMGAAWLTVPIPFAAGEVAAYQDYTPQYVVSPSGLVWMTGLVTRSDADALFTLPEDLWPRSASRVVGACGGNTCRLNLEINGEVRIAYIFGDNEWNWVSLSPFLFVAADPAAAYAWAQERQPAP